ncbi:MAG: hybrid sensor histidine kinase/response regulator [Micavibrio sp.]|nr:hybrid sensor histidine kinase/response regulator [Micavibrio sp.]
MDDLVAEFLTETNESLDELDNDLVNLEQNPNDKDLLSKIFRLMHTIKGTCGFLDLPKLAKVAHHAENVLGRFRDGDLEVTPEYVTLIFESIDTIKFIVGEIEMNGEEPDTDDSSLINKLDAVYEGRGLGGSAAESGENRPSAPSEEENNDAEAAPDEQTAQDGAANAQETESDLDENNDAPIDEDTAIIEEPEAAPPQESKQDTPKTAAKKSNAGTPPVSNQTLRVNVDVLENLMTMVSELVLTRNQLLQILRVQGETDFTTPLQRLNHVVSDLQEGVMQTRMQPIGNAWSKLPRIIRDLSLELNKKVELKMLGQDTELDRQVLDLIKDPLTHMVRNSADHGIELPADRLAAGKPETGTVILNAFHEGGHIIIEISDDGKGLSTEKIKEKILSNGLAGRDELEDMTSQQIQQYIFRAGFSTAEKVTSVSGRGVGMDVVRTNIEKIGGSIELHSEEGKGSTFTIKIPLTLAIVSALIVESAGERFAIPQLAVRELVMASANGDNRIEMIKGSPVFRLRDHLLPLVTLSNILQINPEQQAAASALHEESVEDSDHASPQEHQSDQSGRTDQASQTGKSAHNHYIIVTQVGNYTFGIIVDKVFDTEEIVVKPVSKILRNIDLFAGNTILGDGSVIMILDPNGVARATGEIDTSKSKAAATAAEALQKDNTSKDKISLLLFSAGDKAPKAVPLSLVARLENIRMDTIERSSGQMLVQYRGSLMPLIPFNTQTSIEDAEEKPVLVFSDKTTSLGLIVDKIIDITEEHIDIQVSNNEPGLMGSAIINNKATDVIDVAHFLNSINKDWYKDHGDEPYGSAKDTVQDNRKRRILLVDDSPFFRNMLTPLLSVAGYEVTTLESPLDALKMCEDGAQFDLIVSDIEMPEMDGFEFAEKVKNNTKWQNTPMVALTSHATPQDIDRGVEVGFSKYIAKFDRDTLLNTLSQTLSENKIQGEAS